MTTTLTRPATEWLDGAPDHLRPETLAIDRRVCRALKCGQCHKRGLTFTPQHTAAGRYRVLAVCPECGRVEHV